MRGRRKDEETGADSDGPRARRRTARKPGRGTLLVVSMMLLASAGLRITETWGRATALDAAAMNDTVQDAAQKTAPDVDFEEILASLAKREARVAEREAQLDTRAEALALAEQRIDEKLRDLVAAEEALRGTIALSESAAETDLAQLTAVYENMGAEEAAGLFGQMTPEFAAGFLGRMRPDIAAAILARLDPVNAYEISVILAGRNALAPTE